MIKLSKTAAYYNDEIDSLRSEILNKVSSSKQKTDSQKYKFIMKYFEKFSDLNTKAGHDFYDGLKYDFTAEEFFKTQELIYFNIYVMVCLVSPIKD